GGPVYQVGTADLDGDGTVDLIATPDTQSTSGVTRVVFGNGSVAELSFDWGATPAFTIADFDGDQVLDLALVARTDTVTSCRGLYILSGPLGVGALPTADDPSCDDGTKMFGTLGASAVAHSRLSAIPFPREVAAVDMDGDDRLDLVLADYGFNAVSSLEY